MTAINSLKHLLRSRTAAFVHDAAMIPVAWLGAYWLRFNLDGIPVEYWRQALAMLPLALAIQGGLFWHFGLYRGVWRFASVPDLVRIVQAVLAGVVVTAVAIFFLNRLQGAPRSVFVLDGILLVLLLGGPRFVYRWLKDRRLYGLEVKNVLIVGAGQAGEMLVRDLLRDPQHVYRPVAFVDDDPAKQGKELHGVRVAGGCDAISGLTTDLDVQLILIALPSAKSRQMQRVVELCERTGLPFRVLPHMKDLVSGQVSIKELREVKIDDLLGREAVSLDWQAITRGVQGRTVLVTGGGGSIGSELCRQIARLKPAQLVIFEQSEFNLYSIELELRQHYPELPLTALLGDIADQPAVDRLFQNHHPDVIFHAAAYKHVPLLEHQLRAAVRNNDLGTRVLATAADHHGCATFVMISTDKAVNPANIMGMTKRVAEIYCQNLSDRSKTHFITVRFGNVLGSAGSVIPLFQKQIAEGGPVTVTHPEISRFFMTIPEAAQLILQAGAMGKGGEIFVLDMGEPVKIAYLAEQLILLSGKKPGEDIEIVYTGLRPGEKLYEELFHESEKLTGTGHPKILLSKSRSVDSDALQQAFDRLNTGCEAGDVAQLYTVLCELVPEHQSICPEGAAESATARRPSVIIPLHNPKNRS
jgi:FlaA1/EpsC-like NDP-sugar epimerase